MSWSPDGRYLAVGGGNGDATVRIYSFDGANLTLVASRFYGIYLWGYAWSPDGRYLAAVGTGPSDDGFGSGGGDEIKVYKFNGQTLLPQTSMPYGNWVIAVGWHPSNNYLAIGGDAPTNSGRFGDGNTDELRVYRFDQTMTLTPLVHKAYSSTGIIKTLQWSPDGNYLLFAGENPNLPVGGDGGVGQSDDMRLYGFNGATLSPITGRVYGNSRSVNWHPDGKTVSISGLNPTNGGNSGFNDSNILRTYRFDGAALQPVYSLGTPSSGLAYSCPWHPSGNYIGEGTSTGSGVIFYIINTLFTTSANAQAITNSLVFGNSSLANATNNLKVKLLSGARVEVRGQVYDASV
jgi:Tol biopolymer transport system component